MTETTIGEVCYFLQNKCRTSNLRPCTTKMAGYLHGLLNEVAHVPKDYHYVVLEVVFCIPIYTFSMLAYDTCHNAIDIIQNNQPAVPATLYMIYFLISKQRRGNLMPLVPGEYAAYLPIIATESVYAF